MARANPIGTCPCGRPRPYDGCCARVHRVRASAERAEDVMRARYVAYVLGDERFLLESWHPSTRPARLDLDASVRWTGLTVTATVAGGPTDVGGEVSFVAAYELRGAPGVLAERSRFERAPDGWVYVNALA